MANIQCIDNPEHVAKVMAERRRRGLWVRPGMTFKWKSPRGWEVAETATN